MTQFYMIYSKLGENCVCHLFSTVNQKMQRYFLKICNFLQNDITDKRKMHVARLLAC